MKKEEKKSQILWQLFKATFLLSAFTFGGGFVIVSLMKKKFVEELGWLDESEMLDITAIAQSSPGPIPINASVILGYRMCGIPGSLVAILGTALPPMIDRRSYLMSEKLIDSFVLSDRLCRLWKNHRSVEHPQTEPRQKNWCNLHRAEHL